MNNDRLKVVLRFTILLVLLASMMGLVAGIIYEFSDAEPEPGIVALIGAALGSLTTGVALAIKSFFPDSKD